MRFLNKLAPEKNIAVRSALYVMAGYGYVHLVIAIVVSIRNHKIIEMNPYRMTNLDRVFGNISYNFYAAIFGWLVFLFGIVVIYWLLKRAKSV